jgi:O-antigen/teichoic acid export membrane protein
MTSTRNWATPRDEEGGRASGPGLTGRVVAGSLWTFLGTGTQNLFQLLVVIVLARLVSPIAFGMVAAALLVVGFSSIFSQLGVGPAIVQRLTLTSQHVRIAFTMSVLLSLALTTLLWASAPLIAAFFRMDGLTPVLRALSLVFVCQGLATVADSLAQRELQFRWLASIDVASYALGFALVGVGLALAGWGIWALVAAHVAQSSVRTSMLLFAQPHPKRLLLRKAEIAELMYFGGGFTLARVGNYLAGQGDNLVVGRWLGPQALGLYSHAYQFMVAPAVLIGQVLDKVLFPTMARIQLEPQRLAKAYHRGITLIALVILPFSAILYVLAPELILVLLGPAWAGAAVPFRVLALGMLFRTSYKLSDSVARAAGAVYRRAWRQACYAVAVLLGSWLGQSWGLGGVALGVLAAIALNFVLMAQLSLSLIGMPWRTFWAAHLPALPLSVACGGSVWLLAILLRRLDWPALAIVSCSGVSALALSATLCACAPALFLGSEGAWLRRTVWALLPFGARAAASTVKACSCD